jgi:hypothetical protein
MKDASSSRHAGQIVNSVSFVGQAAFSENCEVVL